MRWEDARGRLGLGDDHATAWAATWADEDLAVDLPTGDRLDDVLGRTDVPDGARRAVHDAVALALDEPAAGQLVACLVRTIAPDGRPRPQPLLGAPAMPTALGDAGALLALLPVLALLEAGRGAHRAQGVPEAIVDATFTDVGAKVLEHHEVHGRWGFADLGWLTWHLAGQLWRVGRLHHQASVLWQPLVEPRPVGAPAPLAPVVDLHVPAGGPLDPDAVDRSLADARALLARVRPALVDAARTCWSWLVDPRIVEVAGAHRNVARFAQRFRVLPLAQHWDPRLRLFLYRVPADESVDRLPRRTSLQRAVAEHLEAGGGWDCALGILE